MLSIDMLPKMKPQGTGVVFPDTICGCRLYVAKE